MEELIGRIVQLFLALTGAYAIGLWFALIVWTYRDITTRSASAVTHIFSTLVVVLFWVPGAIFYLLLRPKETLEEAFQRTIEEEYLLQDLDDFRTCPSCDRSLRDDFIYCPHCRTRVRTECPGCRQLVDLRWEICPFCATVLPDAPGAVTQLRRHQASVSGATSTGAPRAGARASAGDEAGPAMVDSANADSDDSALPRRVSPRAGRDPDSAQRRVGSDS